MFIPDPLQKTTKIPVRIVNGKVEFFYGGDLPALRDGTVGDLVVPSHALLSPRALDLMGQELDIEILSEPAMVWFAVKPSNASDAEKFTEKLNVYGMSDYRFVPFKLRRQLFLHLQGTKTPKLVDCECDNEPLEIHAKSLNHAYRLVSRRLELQRRAHGGNVFLRAFYRDGRAYRPLGELRDAYEARLEQHLIFVTRLNSMQARFSTRARDRVPSLLEEGEVGRSGTQLESLSSIVRQSMGAQSAKLRELVPFLKSETEPVGSALQVVLSGIETKDDDETLIEHLAHLLSATGECVFRRLRIEDEHFAHLLHILNELLAEIAESLQVEAELSEKSVTISSRQSSNRLTAEETRA